MNFGTTIAVKTRGFTGRVLRRTHKHNQVAYVVEKTSNVNKRRAVTVLKKNTIALAKVFGT